MELDRSKYSADNCSVRRTLDVIGERWTLLILRDAFFGLRRFDDFVRVLGCPRNVLAERLRTLVSEGLMERSAYQVPGTRARSEYRLTVKGMDLLPTLLALMHWGDRWVADPTGPPVIIEHRECGNAVSAMLTCTAGHGPLTARETQAVPGPGATLVAQHPTR